MLLPTGASSFTEAMKMGSETYHILKKVIAKKYGKDGESTFVLPWIHAHDQPSTSETREDLLPTFRVPRSRLTS
jgi:hypothetical protein